MLELAEGLEGQARRSTASLPLIRKAMRGLRRDPTAQDSRRARGCGVLYTQRRRSTKSPTEFGDPGPAGSGHDAGRRLRHLLCTLLRVNWRGGCVALAARPDPQVAAVSKAAPTSGHPFLTFSGCNKTPDGNICPEAICCRGRRMCRSLESGLAQLWPRAVPNPTAKRFSLSLRMPDEREVFPVIGAGSTMRPAPKREFYELLFSGGRCLGGNDHSSGSRGQNHWLKATASFGAHPAG